MVEDPSTFICRVPDHSGDSIRVKPGQWLRTIFDVQSDKTIPRATEIHGRVDIHTRKLCSISFKNVSDSVAQAVQESVVRVGRVARIIIPSFLITTVAQTSKLSLAHKSK